MRYLRLIILAVAAICVLALGVFAFVSSPREESGGDVIIIKGGSLTLICPDPTNAECLSYDKAAKEYKHKKGTGKVEQIVIKDEAGGVLGNFNKANFPNGKPSIEITYK